MQSGKKSYFISEWKKGQFSYFEKGVCTYYEHNPFNYIKSLHVRKFSRSTSVNMTSAFFSYFGPERGIMSTDQNN